MTNSVDEQNYNEALRKVKAYVANLGPENPIANALNSLIQQLKSLERENDDVTTQKLTVVLNDSLALVKNEISPAEYIERSENIDALTTRYILGVLLACLLVIGLATVVVSGLLLPLMILFPVLPILILCGSMFLAGISMGAIAMGGTGINDYNRPAEEPQHVSYTMMSFFKKAGYTVPEQSEDSDDYSDGYSEDGGDVFVSLGKGVLDGIGNAERQRGDDRIYHMAWGY